MPPLAARPRACVQAVAQGHARTLRDRMARGAQPLSDLRHAAAARITAGARNGASRHPRLPGWDPGPRRARRFSVVGGTRVTAAGAHSRSLPSQGLTAVFGAWEAWVRKARRQRVIFNVIARHGTAALLWSSWQAWGVHHRLVRVGRRVVARWRLRTLADALERWKASSTRGTHLLVPAAAAASSQPPQRHPPFSPFSPKHTRPHAHPVRAQRRQDSMGPTS